MRTQSVSNQNFTGELKFITRYGKPSVKRLPKELEKYGANLAEVRNILKDKPYDLYVTEQENRIPWLVKISPYRKKANQPEHYISKTLSAYFLDVAKEVMEKHDAFLMQNIK